VTSCDWELPTGDDSARCSFPKGHAGRHSFEPTDPGLPRPSELLIDREFEYLLNRVEAAAQNPIPRIAGYPEHRRALFKYVADLQRENARLREFETAVVGATVRLCNSRLTPEQFRNLLNKGQR